MLAMLYNKVTCCWPDCHQVGSNPVVHGEVILEYCNDHFERAIFREDMRRRGTLKAAAGKR